MTSFIDLTNFGVACAGLIVAFIGLFITLGSPYMDKGIRKYFEVFFSLLIAYILSDLVSQISLTMLGSDYAILSRVCVFSESFFSAILMPMLTWFLLKCAGKKTYNNPYFVVACILFISYFITLIITQFTRHIYFITDDNVYHRGPLYPTLLISPALLMLLNLTVLIRYRKSLSSRLIKAFSIYIIVPLICMLIQMCMYGLLLIVIGSSVSSLFLLTYIHREQMDVYVAQREENARAQVSINVLQMRPHFIYNTMTSIYYLCEQNPKKAMEMIESFTNYLRKNFQAIAKHGTIPFREELEHVRTYLNIEQIRFEGKLFVEFDTPHMGFRIPPLTLQPIVENAVKYGVDPELDPLYISVSTNETEDGNEIIVTDNGPGFDENENTADNNREPHIAINNIRERLSMMCNGTISFSARDGGGTIVRIYIPRNYSSIS